MSCSVVIESTTNLFKKRMFIDGNLVILSLPICPCIVQSENRVTVSYILHKQAKFGLMLFFVCLPYSNSYASHYLTLQRRTFHDQYLM